MTKMWHTRFGTASVPTLSVDTGLSGLAPSVPPDVPCLVVFPSSCRATLWPPGS